jgi:hypothetical protein|tara:strand:+ start:2855 stop:3118 length:264 start_codon:yes stop_codon:yes gene_type:complete
MSIELSKLLKALSEGVTTVTFEKIDTKELRVMPCTTNKEFDESLHTSVGKQSSNADTIVMYALDKKAWRDVRVDTIKDWYEGYPKKI